MASLHSLASATIALAHLVSRCFAQINLYPDDLTPSPVDLDAGCISAINDTVNCDSSIVSFAFQDFYGSMNTSVQDSICAATCGSALSTYRANVLSTCGSTAQMDTGYPVTYVGDLVWAYYNLTCLTDSTGAYCTDYISSIASDLTTDSDITSLNSSVLCSPCMTALLRNRQGTAFSGYDTSEALAWASIQSTCGTSYPTAVQSAAASPTSLPGYANSSYTASCLSGNTYTVVSGDNCQAIAHSNSVATGTLIIINQILPGCTDIEVGQALCLPQKCTTYTVTSGDTCISIAATYGLPMQQFLAWNPSINSGCTNLLADTDICVSIPGGEVWNGTTVAGATGAQTAVYATSTVAPAGPTASGTTSQCGKYYDVQPGDICELIALNNTILVPLFEAINPSVNSSCGNLVPGLYYCVWPTADWNLTATSNGTTTMTTVSAPGPTASGASSSCYRWYVVQSGDNCQLIEQEYGVTLAQLQAWNPSINDDCSNLLADDAYCVEGQVASTGAATVAPPGPTISGTTGSCYEWHIVQSGDTCYLLEQSYGITFAQFQAWNPSVNDSCGNLDLAEAYCVKGPST